MLLVYFLIIATTSSIAFAQDGLILTEIMFNPAGNENFNEFVEIYNRGDASINLSGYTISDGVASDEIISAGNGLILEPLQYGVILDNGYFDNSTQYDAIIPQGALVMTIDGATIGSRGLLNSAPETVTISTSSGITIAEYTYTVDNSDGYSDEKIDLNAGDDLFNWSNSIVLNGTPGFRNSVFPLGIDLAMKRIYTEPLNPVYGEQFSLNAVIENRGTITVSDFNLTFFVELKEDSIFSENELLSPPISNSTSLLPSDSIVLSIDIIDFPRSVAFVGAIVLAIGDERTENNIAFTLITLEFNAASLLINEVMYDPFVEGEAFSPQSEYIELFNPTDRIIGLSGWSISDSDTSRQTTIDNIDAVILAGGYYVLSADSNQIEFFGDNPDKTLIIGSTFPRLNNDGDTVFLFGPSGKIIDRVSFTPEAGGGRGVSIEKIDPFSSSEPIFNWLSSVELLGGTPGEINSVSKKIKTNNLIIELTPNPFSPDGDGIDDALTMNYTLPSRSVIMDIFIFDSLGRQVRRLLNSLPSGSEGSFEWDGLGDNGRKLPIGIYIIYFEATAPLEGKVYSEKAVAVLARKF
ncbi:MAG: lamin tail domain-containing protein [Candidatus Marinimicrobia bacterium]|nr:lamin tail domain-containing protein [Candidatus Neomarinimicrobiota bacterium]